VATYPNADGINQYWRIINRGNGDHAIQNLLSGRVVDVAGGSLAENANIQQWQWNGTNAQLWRFERVDPCADLGGDTDGDGLCDDIDPCPNLNDALIGTACDDNNPGTVNDVWQSNCACQGTLICNIGATCEDGDPCTIGETYDSFCNCVGGTLVTTDADNDGICDAADQCPLNDNLIGQPCDDGNPLTLEDAYVNCTCIGLQYGCDDPGGYSADCDYDLDGLTNEEDQDDDNDGILDIEECTQVALQVNNPSFNGTIGSGPTGVSDINSPAVGYNSAVPAVNSPDGGTWITMTGYDDALVNEGVQQQFNFTAGDVYNISFESANFGIQISSFGELGQIEVLIDAGSGNPTTVIGTSPEMPLGSSWYTNTISYTASTSGVHTLAIRGRYTGPSNKQYSYLSVDGFDLTIPADCDIDNDGINNQFDADSDGDGCADALEGGATININALDNDADNL